jgi:epoxyqueuosine reductase
MSEKHMILAARITAQAHQLGFDLVGIAPVSPSQTASHYQAWLEEGYHAGMAYLGRTDAVAKRSDLERVLPGVRSVVTVGINHHTVSLPLELAENPARGIIASYAWGDDYHEILAPRLRQLAAFVEAQVGQPVARRVYVDTGPLLERELAARAGLGFVGKNTNLIHPRLGSWLLLGELLLSVDCSPDGETMSSVRPGIPTFVGSCGRCTRCLEACPTGALVAPYVLDARRCISYLTIELKGAIPRDLRPSLGNRIFGCDICQEVCPWNRRFARLTAEPAFQPRPDGIAPHLLHLMRLDEEGFRQRFRDSPIKRAKRRGLLRNVAVALGNWGNPAAVPALGRALGDSESLIRGHAAWALGRVPTEEAQRALEQTLGTETDERVREELEHALWSGAHGVTV